MPSVLDKIIQVDFPENQYYKEIHPKKQIVLHHTVSGPGVEGDINWWKSTPDHVATCVIIARDGKIYQCFGSKYWAHHLGITSSFLQTKGYADYKSRNDLLNKQSIGIEIDSWGGLVEKDGKWYNAVWDSVAKKNVAGTSLVTNVHKYPGGYRGYMAFEKYTQAQMDAVKELLLFWKSAYPQIPIAYNADIWDINQDALDGTPGLYTHTSYRADKSDTHPQPELRAMLQSL